MEALVFTFLVLVIIATCLGIIILIAIMIKLILEEGPDFIDMVKNWRRYWND